MKMGFIAINIALLSLAIQGCVIMPIPASGKKVSYGKRIEKKDIAFIQIGATRRSEILQRFGVPDKSYDEPDVTVYWWLRVVGNWYGFSPLGPSAGAGKIESDEMLILQFDEQGLVRKFALNRIPRSGITQEFVTNWAEHPRP